MSQVGPGEPVYQHQQSAEIDGGQVDVARNNNRCASLATPDGECDDELGGQRRPYRCHVCRVGFKLKVAVTIIRPHRMHAHNMRAIAA